MKTCARTSLFPSVDVTDDREARSVEWFAALVQTNCERSVATKLTNLSFENYVPIQEEMRRWSDRMKKVQRLVIPNIIFVRTQPERLDELRRYSFIRCLLANPGEKVPAVIPHKQIAALQYMLGQVERPVFMESDLRRLKIGGQVRVIRGSFVGLEGSIFRIREGDLHVGVLIKNLGFAHVNININDIENI